MQKHCIHHRGTALVAEGMERMDCRACRKAWPAVEELGGTGHALRG